MVGNNFVYTQFQRRRRRSNPPSPTSPTSTRRPLGKLDNDLQDTSRGDVGDGAPQHVDSPSLDVDVASSVFSIPEFSPTTPGHDVSSAVSGQTSRFSDEYAQRRPRPFQEQVRPTTSGASPSPVHTTHPIKSQASYFSRPYDSSPASRVGHGDSNDHDSPETVAHLHNHTPTPRHGPNTTSLAADKLTIDDTSSGKSHAGRKSRLNLLNPMSLLARRRSSQAHSSFDESTFGASTLAVPAMPDDYDPRIRGKIIHDFSAPRTRRKPSYNDAASPAGSPHPAYGHPANIRRASDLPGLQDSPVSRVSPSPKHSPMFKEHLDDESAALRPGQTAYLQSLAVSDNTMTEDRIQDLPAFAKRLPAKVPLRPEQDPGENRSHRSSTGEPDQASQLRHAVSQSRTKSAAFRQTDTKSDDKDPSQPATDLPSSTALPKHMTSTSSRFSFQLGGMDSAAQERLLEERHTQHVASQPLRDSLHEEEGEDDPYHDYDFDEDDGLEERIPGVNADAEDEDEISVQQTYPVHVNEAGQPYLTIDTSAANEDKSTLAFDSFHFTPHADVVSPASTQAASQPTPRDADGHIIGLADTKDSPGQNTTLRRRHKRSSLGNKSVALNGLGIISPESSPSDPPRHPMHTTPTLRATFNDDDLYFDDGDFGDTGDGEEVAFFDEALFDDESGAIRNIPALNAKNLALAQQKSQMVEGYSPGRDLVQHMKEEDSANEETTQSQPVAVGSTNGERGHHCPSLLPDPQATGLTEGNLAAYHAALASAADAAALSGRFTRSVSISHASEDLGSPLEESQPGLVSDESRVSRTIDTPAIDDDDGFLYDDDMDDDLMIAEANAEVLENDDEGFYGQEFGFYARARGKNSFEFANGGYFAPRGSNGVKRNHSAKGNFQEPSLTPITERSEWSTRNSVASMQMPGIPGSAHTLPSPGIAQLLEFDSNFEDDMSLSALMKLRRGAFGGSSTSVNSLGGGASSLPGSSPLAQFAGQNHSYSPTDLGHRMTSSMHSLTSSANIPESEEEDDTEHEQDGDPTLMQSTPRKKRSDSSPRSPQDYPSFSPSSATSEKAGRGHSRTSSGGESISYVRDRDGWLLERRRTGDDGEHEVVGREYLAGARI